MLEILNIKKHLLGLGEIKKGKERLKKENGLERIKSYYYIYIHLKVFYQSYEQNLLFFQN